VDLLLDSAAMGVNIVEREGISFSHPARFILVGTMNPEEGELRPQLLDRFALCVDIQSIADTDARVEILQRRVVYEQDSDSFCTQWCGAEATLSDRIAEARLLLPRVLYDAAHLYAIAALTSEMEVDGHRADIVILKTALAHAAFEKRERINEADILLAAELALPHRLRRKPFEEIHTKMEKLEKRLEEARGNLEEAQKQAATSGMLGQEKKTYSLRTNPSSAPASPRRAPR
jgi:Mg-chelatase subunit ChlI